LLALRRSNGVVACSHFAGGTGWIGRNEAAPVLVWDIGAHPNEPTQTWGDVFPLRVPNSTLLRTLIGKELLAGVQDRIAYCTSADHGVTWDALADMPTPAEMLDSGGLPVSWLPFDFLSDLTGRKMLMCAYVQEAAGDPGVYSAGVWESEDLIHWTLRGWIRRASGSTGGASETCLVRLGTRLLAVIRHVDNLQTGLTAYSDDDGATWTDVGQLAGVPATQSGCAWQGQRGYALDEHHAAIFGRTWDLGGDLYGGAMSTKNSVASAGCAWVVNRDGQLTGGPIQIAMLGLTSYDINLFYCATVPHPDGHRLLYSSGRWDAHPTRDAIPGGQIAMRVWEVPAVQATSSAAASYVSPSVAWVRRIVGLKGALFGEPEAVMDAWIADHLDLAEAKTALAVTDTVFGASDLTTRQITALQAAVAFRIGASIYRLVAGQKAGGTEEPIAMEEADSLRMQASLWDSLEGEPAGEAQTWDDLARGDDAATAEDVGKLETGELLPGPDSLDWYRPSWLGQDTVEVW
jgi:hypothetical protein